MACQYTSSSTVESFDLEAAVGESLNLYIYGAQWLGSSWLSDPTAALSAVNDALDSVTDLVFSGVVVLSTLTSAGTAMVFCVDSPVYKGRIYIDPDEVPGLRTAITNALNTGLTATNLTYGDITLSVSQSGT